MVELKNITPIIQFSDGRIEEWRLPIPRIGETCLLETKNGYKYGTVELVKYSDFKTSFEIRIFCKEREVHLCEK